MDINEMFDDDEIQEQTKPTLEEIKKIVDNKRNNISKKYSKEDRIKNLELARERKKQIEPVKKQQIIQPEPIQDTKLEINNNKNNDNDIIKELKNIIAVQNEYLEKFKIEPKKLKQPRQKKPKEQIRTLDISISDAEIKKIIENTLFRYGRSCSRLR